MTKLFHSDIPLFMLVETFTIVIDFINHLPLSTYNF